VTRRDKLALPQRLGMGAQWGERVDSFGVSLEPATGPLGPAGALGRCPAPDRRRIRRRSRPDGHSGSARIDGTADGGSRDGAGEASRGRGVPPVAGGPPGPCVLPVQPSHPGFLMPANRGPASRSAPDS